MPNTMWRIVTLAEGSAVAGELRQILARRVVAVEHHGQRPGCDVLDEAHQQAAGDRRPRQGRLEPRVCGAEDRAVLHMEHEADGSPVVAARHELAQDLDIVVLGVEQAFVERLLEVVASRCDGARDPPLASWCAAWVKHVRVSALEQSPPAPPQWPRSPRCPGDLWVG